MMWERENHHPSDPKEWGTESLEPEIPGGYGMAVPQQESDTFSCP